MARRKAARHRGARPHHRRQNGTREFEGAETDLAIFAGEELTGAWLILLIASINSKGLRVTLDLRDLRARKLVFVLWYFWMIQPILSEDFFRSCLHGLIRKRRRRLLPTDDNGTAYLMPLRLG